MELQTMDNMLPAVKKDMFFDMQYFEHAQRVAKIFSKSSMVPDHFKGEGNIGNTLIAMNYANRVGADVFMVMQNLYIVHGKPGIESKLAIALLNSSGKFTPLKFKYNKDKTDCTAYAKDLKTNETCEGPTISLKMAQAEGWTSKSGSKWKTLPDLMLMYRAAIFFIRVYAPEVLLGMLTKEEAYDIVEMEPGNNGTFAPQEEKKPTGDTSAYETKEPDPPAKEEEKAETVTEGKKTTNYKFLKQMADIKKQIVEKDGSDDAYYKILKECNVEKANDIVERESQIKVYSDLQSYIKPFWRQVSEIGDIIGNDEAVEAVLKKHKLDDRPDQTTISADTQAKVLKELNAIVDKGNS